jgi:hypothetical protein
MKHGTLAVLAILGLSACSSSDSFPARSGGAEEACRHFAAKNGLDIPSQSRANAATLDGAM